MFFTLSQCKNGISCYFLYSWQIPFGESEPKDSGYEIFSFSDTLALV